MGTRIAKTSIALIWELLAVPVSPRAVSLLSHMAAAASVLPAYAKKNHYCCADLWTRRNDCWLLDSFMILTASLLFLVFIFCSLFPFPQPAISC